MDEKKAYVTLLSSDDYYPGVVMLDWSLKKVASKYPLFVLCSDSLSDTTIKKMRKRGLNYQILDDHWKGTDRFNKEAGYEHWRHTFDKLYVWTLTQFDKVVFLDTDMQVIQNIDYLFDKPHMSAVRADMWNEPDLDQLNSGLMVIEPNLKDFEGLSSLWESEGVQWRRNIGDQDVIRAYFSNWGRKNELTLAPGLNVFYSEVSRGIIKQEDVSPVSVIHYIGNRKPWMLSPRAFYRRSRNNFLGEYLIQYAFALWHFFPYSFFNRSHGKIR